MFLKQKHYDWINKVFGSTSSKSNDIDPKRRMFLKLAGSTALIAVAAGSPLEAKAKEMPLWVQPYIQGVLRVRVIDEKFRVLYSEQCADYHNGNREIVWKRYHTDWYEYPGDGVVPDWWICVPVSDQTIVYVESADGSQKKINVVFGEDGQPEPVILTRYRSLKS